MSNTTWVSNVIEGGGYRRPDRGTCPICRKKYSIRKDDCIRRHGSGDCLIKDQLPLEIHSAIVVIAEIGERGSDAE